MAAPPERSLVFNVVWTGGVFEHLRWFVASLVAQSDARFRFVANGCTRESIAAMERWAAQVPDRVVEVVDVSKRMRSHGFALDAVLRTRDDGDHFCLVDADIKARRPWVADFQAVLEGCDAVTSGKEVWTDDNVLPDGHAGVGGRHFYAADGFVFGSPHLALYRRDALLDTIERWGVGFGSAGPDIPEPAKARLAEAGRSFAMYDTGKVVNILFQLDGHELRHVEHPELLHIGGLSHYLAPPAMVERDGEVEPDWARWHGMTNRFEVARFAATMLRTLAEGNEPPDVPGGLEPAVGDRLRLVREELVDLVGRYAA